MKDKKKNVSILAVFNKGTLGKTIFDFVIELQFQNHGSFQIWSLILKWGMKWKSKLDLGIQSTILISKLKFNLAIKARIWKSNLDVAIGALFLSRALLLSRENFLFYHLYD